MALSQRQQKRQKQWINKEREKKATYFLEGHHECEVGIQLDPIEGTPIPSI